MVSKAHLLLALGLVAGTAGSAQAQYPRAKRGQFEVRGLDFRPNGVWRVRAAAVRKQRQRLLSAGSFSALNARVPGLSSGAQVTGSYFVPVLPVTFSNVAEPFTESSYQAVLFHDALTPGYSLKTFYEELSDGRITMGGHVFPWATMDSSDVYYEDNCNGVGVFNPCDHGGQRFADLLTATLDAASHGADSATVWANYDNDGPDGIPNSGDDDGVVDMVAFIQADLDGACGTQHIWAHRYVYAGWNGGSPYVTRTPWTGHSGQFLKVNDYTMQSAVGGPTACTATPTQIMPIGTLAHEFGHGFGLPDLYDTDPNGTEGIGEWGLMGSGNYTMPYSPSRMSAWSLVELGWVAVDTVAGSGSYRLPPVASADTVLLLPVPGTDEYFLLENRQSEQSDTAQMGPAASTHIKAPGLLVWHVDSGQINAHGFDGDNRVNVGPVHGVALLQADARGDLDLTSGGNRGDKGDAYPGHLTGMTPNRRISALTTPALLDNQQHFVGFMIDSIYEVTPGIPGPMAFRIVRRPNSVVAADQAGALITVNGLTLTRFDDILAPGDAVQLGADSAQTGNNGRSHFVFQSWSTGGARTSSFVAGTTPDTVTAHFGAEHRLDFRANGLGAVTAVGPGPVVVDSGSFLAAGTAVTLVATPPAGTTFTSWTGDTTASSPTLVLGMARPYAVVANFSSVVAISLDQATNAMLGKGSLTTDQAAYIDNLGNHNGVYDLGDFLAYLRSTGRVPNPAVMQEILARAAAATATPARAGAAR